jgi:hypothetical protein
VRHVLRHHAFQLFGIVTLCLFFHVAALDSVEYAHTFAVAFARTDRADLPGVAPIDDLECSGQQCPTAPVRNTGLDHYDVHRPCSIRTPRLLA